MIKVTERAATQAEQVLAAKNAAAGEGLKLVPAAAGQVGVTIAPPADGDEVVRRGEDPLVIVDGSIAPRLDGSVLDVREADGPGDAPRFTLRAP